MIHRSIGRAWSHMRSLWPRWTLLPPAPWVLWCLYQFSRGVFRWDLIGAFILALTLSYTNQSTKRLLIGIYPACLVGVLYDSMKLFESVGVSKATVHLCDLRAHELAWFGFESGGVRMTPGDWLQQHTHPVLDAICAIPYGTFIFVILGYAVYLYFRDFTGLQRFAWSFLILNVLGFVTYHVYPAAPPWYFHSHGCVVDLATHASEGPGLSRVDAMLGFNYFQGMYGRSSDVFGAVPSLHSAYPLLLVLEGWRHNRWAAWFGMLAFCVTMWFAAVYLDHHWVTDVLLGITYSAVTYTATSLVFRRLKRRALASPLADRTVPVVAGPSDPDA